MVKYVYTDTNMPVYRIHFYELIDTPKYPICLKSHYADGRIIADDNQLEGL